MQEYSFSDGVNTKLLPNQRELLEDTGHYRRLMGNYLTVTGPDITFAVSMMSQFLSAPWSTHLEAIMRLLRYMKKAPYRGLLYSNHGDTRVASFSYANWVRCPFDRKSTTGYCVFLERNLVS